MKALFSVLGVENDNFDLSILSESLLALNQVWILNYFVIYIGPQFVEIQKFCCHGNVT